VSNINKNLNKRLWSSPNIIISGILILSLLVGCGPSAKDLEAVDYTPSQRDDWEVSTPEEHGLDPDIVAEMYYDAANLDTLYSVLVIKELYLSVGIDCD
jgi:hypothetical protein